MIINREGAEFLYEGITYRIGDRIIGTEASEYAGLNGIIYEIRDGDDKETENDTPDIYCSFEEPVLPSDIEELEKTFTELYQEEKHLEDIILDCVIMAPEMIMVSDHPRKSIKVYVLTEDWAIDCNHGRNIRPCSSLWEAKAHLNSVLTDEIKSGCITDWIDRTDYMTETSELSYEGWIEGRYVEKHYKISIEELEMSLSPTVVGDVGRVYLDSSRYEDFVSQVEEWEEVGELSEQDYQKFLADKRIPDMIDKKLGDHYWESYWEAVSEAAHTLLREYLGKNTHSQSEFTD